MNINRNNIVILFIIIVVIIFIRKFDMNIFPLLSSIYRYYKYINNPYNSSTNKKHITTYSKSCSFDLKNNGTIVKFIGGDKGEDDMLLLNNKENIIKGTNLSSKSKTNGCLINDLNDNGYLDIIVCREDGITVYINNKDGTFTGHTIWNNKEMSCISISLSDSKSKLYACNYIPIKNNNLDIYNINKPTQYKCNMTFFYSPIFKLKMKKEILIVYGEISNLSLFRFIETFIETKFRDNISIKTINIITFKYTRDTIDPKNYILFVNCDDIILDLEFTRTVIEQFPYTNAMYNLDYFYKDDYCKQSLYKLDISKADDSSDNIDKFFNKYKDKQIIKKNKNSSESRCIMVYNLINKELITSLNEFEYITPYISNSYVIECACILNQSGKLIFPHSMYFWKDHKRTIEVQHKRFYKDLTKVKNKNIIKLVHTDINQLIKKCKFKFGYFRFEYIYDLTTKNIYLIDFSNSPTSAIESMLYKCLNIDSFDEIIRMIFS